ncbi:HAD-like domain-containing protein [Peziza echinospora]|nr:HAD-like domain-containing protein [Peziza echinospora]
MACRVARLPSVLPRPRATPTSPLRSTQNWIPQSKPQFQQARFQSLKQFGAVPASKHDFAFAFDIDGVLLHGSTPIPPARPALTHLLTTSTPFLLLTNGGGISESARVHDLTQKLSLPILESQFVQSHTPFKSIAAAGVLPNGKPLENCILVVGGDGEKVRHVAEGYGFKNVVMSQDILVSDPGVWPFTKVTETHISTSRPLPKLNTTTTGNSGQLKFDAIFVYNDPRDWALDTQLIIDLLLSNNGVLGTENPFHHNHTNEEGGKDPLASTPPIFFSNPDVIWASPHPTPRLGQGAFRHALEGVWRNHPTNPVPGSPLPNTTVIGKPHRETYVYAENVLSDFINNNNNSVSKSSGERERGKLKRVYMVGDNPDSDIRGANDFVSERGVEWISVLVKTGVYKHVQGRMPHVMPRKIVEHVGEAVEWACLREQRIARGEKVEDLD